MKNKTNIVIGRDVIILNTNTIQYKRYLFIQQLFMYILTCVSHFIIKVKEGSNNNKLLS